ncbi:hypothetical protein X798_02238 [Onchocerca flexuosa]|uniref:Heme-copper oxidase subunit III family profile domain-containing protein n=1 Tax=Onchocerca flexuosa TaxID=387005 RepID=A0A238C124_9BILA|nr:hypothetical protein X798_02238 [Onchocerca flexuosa]
MDGNIYAKCKLDSNIALRHSVYNSIFYIGTGLHGLHFCWGIECIIKRFSELRTINHQNEKIMLLLKES